MPRTGLKPEEIRLRAIEIARDHMRRLGFANLRFSEVARDIGVSHVALYAHFADKGALLDAVSETWVIAMDAKLQTICDGDAPPLEKLRQWFQGLHREKVDKVAHDPELFKAFDTLAELKKPFCVRHIENLHRQLRGLIREALDIGVIVGEPAEIQAVLLEATIAFYHPRLLVSYLDENREDALRRVLNVLLAGLARNACQNDNYAERLNGPQLLRAEWDAWATADPYFQLRDITIIDEQCQCSGRSAIKLMQTIGPNPIHCLVCNLPVPPEKLPLPVDLVSEVANWSRVAQAFVLIDLDCREYEAFSIQEWKNLTSPLNLRGLALAAKLNQIFPTYYWHRTGLSSSDCPVCNARTRQLSPNSVCDTCRLLLDPDSWDLP